MNVKLRFASKHFVCTLLCMLFILGSNLTYAQEKSIKGTVVDENGTPLPGVAVIIKGTTQGTTTNFDGQYVLNVSATDETLSFSYIGYLTKDIVIGAQAVIDVSMEVDAEQLEEVVVIGYGSVKKEDATGSVQAISASDFNQGAINSPQDLLTGKVAGVNITAGGGAPGAKATIRIRGGSSLSASNDPLIVIDGVPIDNNDISGMRNPLNTVNPNDIETFTVLKDASATAIYGSRASNGVILITTKKGSQGGVKFDYSGNVSFGTETGRIEALDATQFRNLMQETGNTNGLSIAGDQNTNWQDELMRTAVSTEHNMAVSGAVADFLPYRASVGYNNSNGILKTSNMERTTVALNLTPKFFDDHLSVNVSAKYMNVKNRFADVGAIGSSLSMDPTQVTRSNDDTYQKFGGYFTWVDGAGNPISIAPSNPLALLDQKDDRSNINRFIGNAQLDYKFHFLPELKANLNVGYDYSKASGGVNVPTTAAWEYNVNDPEAGGRSSTFEQEKKNELIDFYLQYVKDLAGIDSKLDVMAGYSWQHFWSAKYDWATNARGDSPEVYPNATYSDVLTENYLVSFFGRLNYTFKDKYIATVTVRNDGTSRFAPDSRWGLFPAAALAWQINKENFMANSSKVSNLKLRLGWGITGQQNLGSSDNPLDYPYLPVYTYGDEKAQHVYYDPNIGPISYYTIRPQGYDQNLKWEETTTYNAGVDFGFMDDRLTGTIDVYKRITNDLLNTIPVAAGSNLTNRLLTNVGSLENQGLELTLNYKVIQKRDFFWDLGFNFTTNDTKITKLTAVEDPNYKGVDVGDITGGTGQTIQIHQVGERPNAFYTYQQIYDETGRPIEGAYVDRNGDGNIDANDKYIAGDPNPDYYIGINSRITYKNWDFSFSGRYAGGHQVYNNVNSNQSLNNMTVSGFNRNLTTDILNTYFQDYQFQSDYYIEDASFFRLDNIMVGYNFNNIKGGKINARVYGTVNNAFVITKYSGLDPEISGGIDNNIYPRPRTFLLGVNLGF
ncbi:TonB-dependent receptor [Flammeovirga sp. EKP202]|uniref:SusC/RagA family TonB-linked outer membrane protein n=1 Tax=Flammeovirga sp. EKP202 TaxID=2770592 RepID=UPI00165EF377|nr:TonB-dependent receptor [Flammeovirga sp. EKP202]MBD0403419.1 TonB-dependent receptor [Flammeovirga sp. EKP202]